MAQPDTMTQGRIDLPPMDEQGNLPATLGAAAAGNDLAVVQNIAVKVSVVLGTTDLPVRQLIRLGRGAVLELNRKVGEDVDIYNLDDVIWAVLTRARVDRDVLVIPDTPSFYRDPHKEHWGRIGIDATVPFARRLEYERKKIPGADRVELKSYFGQS